MKALNFLRKYWWIGLIALGLAVIVFFATNEKEDVIDPFSGYKTPSISAIANFAVIRDTTNGNVTFLTREFGISGFPKNRIDAGATRIKIVNGIVGEASDGSIIINQFLEVTLVTYDRSIALIGRANYSGKNSGSEYFHNISFSGSVPANTKIEEDFIRVSSRNSGTF